MSRLARASVASGVLGAAAFAYGALIERNAFTLRRFDVPVLPAGAAPIRLLHLSDLHITPQQDRKLAWIRDLASLQPDFVINTGDTISHPRAIPAIMRALAPLFEFPGAFVPGNNDYHKPILKNPVKYFFPYGRRVLGPSLPWPQL